jgi:hypothetical protein
MDDIPAEFAPVLKIYQPFVHEMKKPVGYGVNGETVVLKICWSALRFEDAVNGAPIRARGLP